MKLFLPLVLLMTSAPVLASGDPSYLLELQHRAEQMGLSERVHWRRLLHYQSNRYLPGVTSTVDSENFFLSDSGPIDPEAELQATLASFFDDALREDEPSQCRVKARYEWLKSVLLFDPQRLPEQICERYEKWVAPLNAAALTMVFASSEISGPATMFGHTLMRVDSSDLQVERRLLTHAVNYSAVYFEDDEGSLGYAVRGIFGGYFGVFAVMPYYEKVNEYARIEQRDLWEYPMRLSPDEVQRLLWHLWEMREVQFDYYFFSENCSYMLLSLVEVARPDLKLTESFSSNGLPYVIPIDTIRALQQAGILGEPEYRPAQAQKLRHNLTQLTESEHDWVLDYAVGDAGLDDPRVVNAPAPRRAGLLDTAHDYLYTRYRSEAITRELGLPRAREALLARSHIREKSDFAPLPRPAFSPDEGHASSRLSAGLRGDRDDAAIALRARCALHDLLDPPQGYLNGGQIEFCNLGLLLHDEGVDLSDFTAVGVQAVSPWDRAFKPWSWFADGGLRRFGVDALAAKPVNELGAYVDAGGGMALSVGGSTLAYGYLMTALDLNRDSGDGYALAAGPRVGLSAQWGPQWTQLLDVQWLGKLAGGAEEQLNLEAGTQWSFHNNWGLRGQWRYARFDDRSANQLEVLLNYYF